MQNIFKILIIVAFAFILYSLFENFSGSDHLNSTAQFYAQKENIEAVNSANLVTAIVVTYRGLDTLGEVTILFLAAAVVAFFIKSKTATDDENKRKNSEILVTAAQMLMPLIVLLGVYIFINGHLTPGGGFQGGAVIATAFILMIFTQPQRKFNRNLFNIIESISGFSYVIIGVLGMLLGGGFLDNRILDMGTLGKLISAGAIPIIYVFVGLKVGAELSTLIGNFQTAQGNFNNN